MLIGLLKVQLKQIRYLKNMKKCPFCSLDRRKIIERNNAYLTYNKAPYHNDHVLICTRRHVEHFLDLNENEIDDINFLLREGIKILSNLGYKDYSILLRDGENTQKSIDHIHYHIIPRISVIAEGSNNSIDRRLLTEDEIEQEIIRLKSAIG